MSDKTLSILFAGDSGDGMQLLGKQFTISAAHKGYDIQTSPDFPAEIRAPSGTPAGVSGFKTTLSELPIYAAKEKVDVLVAMNPAALKTALPALQQGGLLLINEDSFKPRDIKKAGYSDDPRTPALLGAYQCISSAITTNTLGAIGEDTSLSHSQAKRCKNAYVLGLVLWLFELECCHAQDYYSQKFASNADLILANHQALKAGYNYAITLALARRDYHLDAGTLPPGLYRHITGVQAIALAIATLAEKTKTALLVSGYPITPASEILHEAAQLSDYGVTVFQAEDEIAAIGASLGASFGGNLALTCTSGPGLDLKAEGLGLAVMSELPLVVVDVQRAGPSTGLPTKTEQSDLFAALYGRHGEAPLPVLAAATAVDCFESLLEAFRIAVKYMTPVILLCDASIANSAMPWRLPDLSSLDLPKIDHNRSQAAFERDQFLARSWSIPGSAGHEYCLGGLEKQGAGGQVSYDADNHQAMITLREQKVAAVNADYPPLKTRGSLDAKMLLLCWGSSWGVVKTVVEKLNQQGVDIAMLHLRHLNPLPKDLGAILRQYSQVLVIELNQGQLCRLIRAEYLIDALAITQCNGRVLSGQALRERILLAYKKMGGIDEG